MITDIEKLIPEDWRKVLRSEITSDYFANLVDFLETEWKNETVFPPKDQIFTALNLTPYSEVKVLILGQDPYHDENQAHGLAFSVQDGVKLPPSLRNIYKELKNDLAIPPSAGGNLESWAKQGILLLNTALTVRAHQANSHAGKGWEIFTDAVIKHLNDKEEPVIFLLWGGNAAKKAPLIDADRHFIIKAPHPSPLSAYRGFFGSKPFSEINKILKKNHKKEIDWQLPESDNDIDMPLFAHSKLT
jgi:uracil-DNA glycosylase